MSYVQYQERCDNCGKEWNAAFGIVGTTQIAAPPEKCPYCGSTRRTVIAYGWKETPMTPDEQPHPVAYCDPSNPLNSQAFAWPGTEREPRHSMPLYAHPPTSAASQPEAVKVTDEMVGLAHDQLLREDEDVDEAAMRRILEAVLNPPAESAARGDVSASRPTDCEDIRNGTITVLARDAVTGEARMTMVKK